MKQYQTYNDGIVSIYKKGNIAKKGDTPKDGLTLKVGPLRFDERTVGMSRYFIAGQSSIKIDRLIRVPRIEGITTEDVVVMQPLDEKIQYIIRQCQYPKGVVPLSMDLSLERIEVAYEIA